ncbi:hypothetical protein BDW75DRAFT_206482 [Aspergillus navahoensis]
MDAALLLIKRKRPSATQQMARTMQAAATSKNRYSSTDLNHPRLFGDEALGRKSGSISLLSRHHPLSKWLIPRASCTLKVIVEVEMITNAVGWNFGSTGG